MKMIYTAMMMSLAIGKKVNTIEERTAAETSSCQISLVLVDEVE